MCTEKLYDISTVSNYPGDELTVVDYFTPIIFHHTVTTANYQQLSQSNYSHVTHCFNYMTLELLFRVFRFKMLSYAHMTGRSFRHLNCYSENNKCLKTQSFYVTSFL